MTLHLLRYNNYYNRIIKRYDTIEEYEDYILESFSNINFNPNDGITAEQIINYNGAIPDYVIICSDNEIVSRWFVIEAVRTRAQQFKLDLYRDTVADYLEFIKSAPMFIEKATLNVDNPLIFNKEDFSVNQIKTTETLLKDGSGCPWIVGYYAKNTPIENLKGIVDANDLDKAYDKIINVPFSSWQYNATVTPFNGLFSDLEYRVYVKSTSTSVGFQSQQGYLYFDKNGNYGGDKYTSESDYSLNANFKGKWAGEELESIFKSSASTLNSLVPAYVNNSNTEAAVRDFLSYNGLTIKDSEGKYYSLSIYTPGYEDNIVDIPSGNLFNNLNNIIKQSTIITGTANTGSYKVWYKRPKYMMIATELTNLETSWDMSGDKFVTDDAPYNIFAIPYGPTQLELLGYAVATSNTVIGMAVANSIIRTMGSNLYDIQLLPYCPVNTPMVVSPTGIGLLAVYDSEAFSVVKTPGGEGLESHVSYVLNVPKAKFSKNIEVNIPAPANATDKKISNECDMYRLCSPNYNGAFEFSVAKNNGVDYFNVDCEYKPFQPYIHVNPNFKGLYGQDFNDARGLICNGDFSLTQIRDEWQQYQIQNKNYQEIFSRQIENMEVQQKYQRIGDIVGSVTGAGSAAVSGAMMGSMIAPGIGTAIGAISGTALSAVGGVADYAINEKLRTEALDYTKDQFGYQLGNIQALPYTLTKVSAFNNNNKLFPFIEYYTCTAEEKEAFRNKLRYNGMTVGVIGTLNDYLLPTESYIKGKLIRLENIEDDFHIANIISNELNKGVFI